MGVDVLTLTATPIPRTLEMALTGIRDVSHIRTPPEDRHPILTYVGPYDEAIGLGRDSTGRSFAKARSSTSTTGSSRSTGPWLDLQDVVPDASYVVAHGQMSRASSSR